MLRVILAAAALATMGAAPQSGSEKAAARDAAALEKALRGLTPQAPVHCINPADVTEMETHRDTILYIQGRGKLWRVNTVGTCDGLKRGDIVVSRRNTSHICEGDIIQTRSRTGGNFTGSCSLGPLVPYSR